MVPRFTPAAFAVALAVFTFSLLLGDRGLPLLLAPERWTDTPWTLVTHALTHPAVGRGQVLVTFAVLWTFAGALEREAGPLGFGAGVVAAALGGAGAILALAGLAPGLAAGPFGGPLAIECAVLTAWVIPEPTRPASPWGAPRAARWIYGACAVALVLGARVPDGLGGAELAAGAAGVAVGALAALLRWRRIRGSGKLSRGPRGSRGHLRVVRSAEDLLH